MKIDWVRYRLETAEWNLRHYERTLQSRRADVRDSVARIRELRADIALLKTQLAERDRP